VNYTIWVKPSHSLGKSARVVVTVPSMVEFDIDKPCFVGGVAGAQCEVTRSIHNHGLIKELRTRIIVTEIFPNGHNGGDQVKFTISPGRNPTGAM